MIRLIDTHCHVNVSAFDQDWKSVVEKTLRAGVDMVVVGTDLDDSKKAIEIAQKYSGVYAAIGFHPSNVINKDWRSEILRIASLIKDPNVVAIGEIGFDRYRMPEDELAEVIKIQETVFDFFLKEAALANKPIILHNRDAFDLLEPKLESIAKLRVRGVQHCFPGNLEEAQKIIMSGLKLGFNGLITYNSKWDKLIQEISINDILLETDSPFLTPVPNRGKRNEPSYVKFVASHVAKLKGLTVDEVAQATTQTANKLFKLKV
jgi:TatD DNase family protein